MWSAQSVQHMSGEGGLLFKLHVGHRAPPHLWLHRSLNDDGRLHIVTTDASRFHVIQDQTSGIRSKHRLLPILLCGLAAKRHFYATTHINTHTHTNKYTQTNTHHRTLTSCCGRLGSVSSGPCADDAGQHGPPTHYHPSPTGLIINHDTLVL